MCLVLGRDTLVIKWVNSARSAADADAQGPPRGHGVTRGVPDLAVARGLECGGDAGGLVGRQV